MAYNPFTTVQRKTIPLITPYPIAPMVSVEWFGADPTGVADSTTAFQNAINTSSSIYIPAGSYQCGAISKTSGDLCIIGAGKGVTQIYCTGSSWITYGDPTGTVFGAHAFTLSGLSFSSPAFSRAQSIDAIRLFGAFWYDLRDFIAYALKGRAIYFGGGVWDGRIHDFQIGYCGDTNKAAIEMQAGAGNLSNNHCKIYDGQIENSYWNDILINGAANGEDGHRISHIKFGSPSTTWSTANALEQYHIKVLSALDVDIHDNWFFEGGAAYILDCGNFNVHDNDGDFMSQGVYVDDNGTNAQAGRLHNNKMQGNGDSSSSVTGSLTSNHWGYYWKNFNGLIGPNTAIAFNALAVIDASVSGNIVESGQVGGPWIDNNGGNFTDDYLYVATLLNSWVSAGFRVPGIVAKGHVVELQGVINNGTTTASTVLFTLPSAYHPNSVVFLTCRTTSAGVNNTGYLQIQTNGDVTVESLPTSTTSVFLDGLSFNVS